MLRSVAGLLAQYGDYCIADVIDDHGVLRRIEIAHADPSRRHRLRVLAEDTKLAPQGRVALLLARGRGELTARVTRAALTGALADVTLLADEKPSSYIATVVTVSGGPIAVLTTLATHPARRFDADDLAFLDAIGEWSGLGLENALRRQLQPRTSVAPPAHDAYDVHDVHVPPLRAPRSLPAPHTAQTRKSSTPAR